MTLSARRGLIIPQRSRILDPTLIRIYDLMTRFAKLRGVDGLEHYSWRSLLMRGLAVVNDSQQLDAYIDFLRSVGIGATEVIRAHGKGSVIAGLDPRVIDRIRNLVLSGHELEFFLATAEYELKFVEERLGYSWGQVVHGSHPALAAKINNKAWLRRIAVEHGFVDFFPRHVTCPMGDDEAIYAAVSLLLEVKGEVILKDPLRASGDGMHFADKYRWRDVTAAAIADLRKTAAEEAEMRGGEPDEVVVEVAYAERLEISVQCEDGEVLAPTVNLVEGTGHTGNIITSGPLPGVPLEYVIEAMHMAEYVNEVLTDLGEEGLGGYDFIAADGRVFMLEKNGRVTGGTGPLAVALQMQAKGLNEWAVITDKVAAQRGTSFIQVQGALERHGLGFDGVTSGVLIACPGTLPEGVAMLQSYAADVPTAQTNLTEATELLKHVA